MTFLLPRWVIRRDPNSPNHKDQESKYIKYISALLVLTRSAYFYFLIAQYRL